MVLLFLMGCIEPVEIDIEGEEPRLVVEGLISNISYDQRTELPQNARPFYVRLGYTREVGNERDPVISDAFVRLHSMSGGSWEYYWSDDQAMYFLEDATFKAEINEEYYIEIQLSNGNRYLSDPEMLITSPQIGEIGWDTKTIIQSEETVSGPIFTEQRGVQVTVDVPDREPGEEYYYRWDVVPAWIFRASGLPEDHPFKTCYVTNVFYFDKINLEVDRRGGYSKELFFLQTDTNHRIMWDFTVWVTKYSLSRQAYKFWEEISIQQSSGGSIFDPPPFELSTNIRNVDDPSEKVSGYFMVAHESSVRWWFNENDLPYDADIERGCAIPPGNAPDLPVPECLDCRQYEAGASEISTFKPEWWRGE